MFPSGKILTPPLSSTPPHPPESFPPTHQGRDRSWQPLLLCPRAQTSRVWDSLPAFPFIGAPAAPPPPPAAGGCQPTQPCPAAPQTLHSPAWGCCPGEMLQEGENEWRGGFESHWWDRSGTSWSCSLSSTGDDPMASQNHSSCSNPQFAQPGDPLLIAGAAVSSEEMLCFHQRENPLKFEGLS